MDKAPEVGAYIKSSRGTMFSDGSGEQLSFDHS